MNYGMRQASAAKPLPASGYRFRPLQPVRQVRMDNPVRYRPLQVRIPDRYVFRPLNPVARPAIRTSPQLPFQTLPAAHYPPAWNALPAYTSMPTPPRFHDYNLSVPYDAARWPDSRRGYPYLEREIQPPAYPPVDAERMDQMPWFHPWYAAEHSHVSMPVYNHRYIQRRPLRSPYMRSPDYAWRYDRRRTMQPYSGHRYTYGQRMEQPAPDRPPPPRMNHYGTNWYDGQGDGEGAWYQLLISSAPEFSQSVE
jgi:hypothetical protein